MTFTYIPSTTPTDVTLVRFHTSDTIAAEAFFSDEEINMMIAQNGSWQNAVIACLQHMWTQIASEPNVVADWFTARRRNTDWSQLISSKQKELGVSLIKITATATPMYRSDSFQDESPEDW
jgi:hypothetical protein